MVVAVGVGLTAAVGFMVVVVFTVVAVFMDMAGMVTAQALVFLSVVPCFGQVITVTPITVTPITVAPAAPPPYYADPYYYPPAVAMESAPSAYAEQGGAQAAPAPAPQQQQNWWYYCVGSNMYYPYVRECPGGWQRVAPQPPAG
jgi:hypothetical protein